MAKDQLELAFNKSAEKRNRAKQLKAEYNQALQDNPQWTKLLEQEEVIKAQKQQILQQTSDAFPKLAEELMAINADLKMDRELLSDLAVKRLVETGEVKIQADDGILYYPEFTAKFKKIKEEKEEPDINQQELI